jgi:hypothetical protein
MLEVAADSPYRRSSTAAGAAEVARDTLQVQPTAAAAAAKVAADCLQRRPAAAAAAGPADDIESCASEGCQHCIAADGGCNVGRGIALP